jgi:hypothetical protein
MTWGGNAMIRSSMLAAFALAIALPAVAGDAPPKDIASRAEVYPIQTLMLSDQQFLTGDAEAQHRAVAAGVQLDRRRDLRHPDATQQAKQAVTAFVRQVLKLN